MVPESHPGGGWYLAWVEEPYSFNGSLDPVKEVSLAEKVENGIEGL